MTIVQVAVLIGAALFLGRLRRGRQLALLTASAAAIFWLQPPTPRASLHFWLPIATLALVTVTWITTSHAEERRWASWWPAAAVMAGVATVVWVARYLHLPLFPGMAVPGPLRMILVGIGLIALGAVVLRLRHPSRTWLAVNLVLLLLVFLVIKSAALTRAGLEAVQHWWPDSSTEVSPAAFSWLGFSYVAFRLLHTIRDRQAGRLPAVSLAEYANYVIFFPAFSAGPIDRIERFVAELRLPLKIEQDALGGAGIRIILGLFKKFVLADLLAVISVSDLLVQYTTEPGWMWLFLYAYSLRIYLDFSGYTDVAIGMGRLLGIQLPENFASPYLKQNIALFWNSWHMTLTQWFRAYVFNPLSRWLRTGIVTPPAWLSVLIAQVLTMVLIGLWHGISWGFAAWGLWHGLGLFIHNRWTAVTRGAWSSRHVGANTQLAARLAGIFVTFHFVSIGWLFFALSGPAISWAALRLLFAWA